MFISFDGIDKSGKSTQVNLLATFLSENGYSLVTTREPGGTMVGEEIKKILLKDSRITPLAELFLYLADRNQHVEQVIKPCLQTGKIVISDRYSDASVAYQGCGRKLGIDFVKKLAQKVTGGLVPDITFFLDLDPGQAMLRGDIDVIDRIEKEKLAFHKRVRAGYLEIAKAEPGRIRLIDASRSSQEIHAQVKAEVLKCLP